jgi:hypothetical protein
MFYLPSVTQAFINQNGMVRIKNWNKMQTDRNIMFRLESELQAYKSLSWYTVDLRLIENDSITRWNFYYSLSYVDEMWYSIANFVTAIM